MSSRRARAPENTHEKTRDKTHRRDVGRQQDADDGQGKVAQDVGHQRVSIFARALDQGHGSLPRCILSG